MDRNNRNFRRMGEDCFECETRYRTERQHGGEQYRENCLCTSQPISFAMAYVKEQTFCKTYPPQKALCKGTLFPELYMPYCQGGCRR